MEEDRRHPARNFDSSLIETYLRGRAVERAGRLPFGRSNTNYRVTFSDGEVCIVRLCNSAAGCVREATILALAKKLVPVPEVLAQGDDWLILSFLQGTVLADTPQHTRAAAEALARIASLKFPSAGWVEPDGSISPFNFGAGSFVESMLARPDVTSWIGPAATAALRAIDARPRSDSTEPPCLVHGDFNSTNILARDGIITGILDWEFSHAGSFYMDIGNLLRHTPPAFHSEIEAGLTNAGRPLPPDWKEKAELIDLTSHLEFLTTQRSDSFKHQCVQWINAFIDRYR